MGGGIGNKLGGGVVGFFQKTASSQSSNNPTISRILTAQATVSPGGPKENKKQQKTQSTGLESNGISESQKKHRTEGGKWLRSLYSIGLERWLST